MVQVSVCPSVMSTYRYASKIDQSSVTRLDVDIMLTWLYDFPGELLRGQTFVRG